MIHIWNINPNSLDNKGSCWILKDFYCSVTMLRELGLISMNDYLLYIHYSLCMYSNTCAHVQCLHTWHIISKFDLCTA